MTTASTAFQRTSILFVVVGLLFTAGCSGVMPGNSSTPTPTETTMNNSTPTTVEITDWNGEFTIDLVTIGNADHVFVETQHTSVNVTSDVTGGVFYPDPILESQRGERGIVTEDHFLLSGDSGQVGSRVMVDLTNATVSTETIEVYAVVNGEERLLKEYTANYTRTGVENQSSQVIVEVE